jgi:hypothetical protein
MFTENKNDSSRVVVSHDQLTMVPDSGTRTLVLPSLFWIPPLLLLSAIDREFPLNRVNVYLHQLSPVIERDQSGRSRVQLRLSPDNKVRLGWAERSPGTERGAIEPLGGRENCSADFESVVTKLA